MQKTSNKSISVAVSGFLQVIIGLMMNSIFGSMMTYGYWGGFMWSTFAMIVSICRIVGIVLIIKGIKNMVLVGRYRKVHEAIGPSGRQRLDILARAMKCSEHKAADRIRLMLARGFWPDGYFDMEAREFVLGEPQMASPADETILKEVKVRPILPWVLFGLVWVGYGMYFSYMNPYAVTMISLVVLVVAHIAIPTKTKVIEDRKPAVQPVKAETGDKPSDDLLDEANGYIVRMVDYNRRISNPRINGQVERLVEVAREILKQLDGSVEKVRAARQFLNYYLPTTVKLLECYQDLSGQTVKGENIGETIKKIEDMMDTLVKAYEKELDDLYREKAMDISADIEVMQSMIRQGGLVDDFFGKQAN